jgi:hypothetical protein
MSGESIFELRGKLRRARRDEKRYEQIALQEGITAEQRARFINAQRSARAEVKLRQKALDYAESTKP